MFTSQQYSRIAVIVGGLALLVMLPACASDHSQERTMLTGPVQAEIIKSREPLPMQITGTTQPIPAQITGTPTVQIAGTPTVQLAEKSSPESWEYSVIESGVDLTGLVEQLNKLGKQGWQVVAELPGGRTSTVLLLKRRA
jgi:hypothetical protein